MKKHKRRPKIHKRATDPGNLSSRISSSKSTYIEHKKSMIQQMKQRALFISRLKKTKQVLRIKLKGTCISYSKKKHNYDKIFKNLIKAVTCSQSPQCPPSSMLPDRHTPPQNCANAPQQPLRRKNSTRKPQPLPRHQPRPHHPIPQSACHQSAAPKHIPPPERQRRRPPRLPDGQEGRVHRRTPAAWRASSCNHERWENLPSSESSIQPRRRRSSNEGFGVEIPRDEELFRNFGSERIGRELRDGEIARKGRM